MPSLAPPPPPPPGVAHTGAGEAPSGFHVGRPWQAPVTAGVVAAVGTVVLGLGDPNTTEVPLCPLHAITGLDCPFCGGLRATHSLAHLDVAGALSHNLLFTVLVPAIVLCWGIWLLRSLGRPVLDRWALPARTGTVLLLVALAFGVLRNLPALSWLGATA